jgi:membrane protein YqaA with SNARE-associated domain
MTDMSEVDLNLSKQSLPGEIKSWQLHKRLYNWVLSWAQTKYGVLALILIAFTEPICVPIPADVMVLGMGFGKPKRAISYSLICSFFSVLGGTTALLLGIWIGGERITAFIQEYSWGPLNLAGKAHKALQYYQEYDFWAIAISALTPVPYMLFSWLGGFAGVSVAKFILISIVFRTLRFGSEGVLIYFFGEKARGFIEKHFNTVTVVVIIILILAAAIIKYFRGG